MTVRAARSESVDGGARPPFEQARVVDAMHRGVVTCRGSTTLREVAQLMAGPPVHGVMVVGPALERGGGVGPRAWGVITAMDIVRNAERAGETPAREVADLDIPTVPPDMKLRDAARLMAEHGQAHLVVEDGYTGEPRGIISSLDIARHVAASAD